MHKEKASAQDVLEKSESNRTFTTKPRQIRAILGFGLAFIYTAFYRFISWIPIFQYFLKFLPDPNQVISDELKPLNITSSSSSVMRSAARMQADNLRSGIIKLDLKPSSLPMEPENQEAKEYTKSYFSKDFLQARKIISRPNSSEVITDVDSTQKSKDKETTATERLKPLSSKELSVVLAPNSPVNSYKTSPVSHSFLRISPLFRFLGFEKSSIPKKPKIPQTKTLQKKFLVLDLDETLIHSSPLSSYKAHLRIEVIIEKMACLYYIYKRPYVDYFLRKVSEWYKIVVYTASIPEYANPVLNFLDPFNSLFHKRLFRDSCIPHNQSYTKDLRLVCNDLSQIILVDNSPISYFINQENAIPISSWMNNDPNDESLLDLLPFLDAIRFTDDVRSILSLRML
ncbi:hypothetical protein BB560_002779 [Smittium megazygosporum]|uniref:FCP1 homology domain-containing protein n=1 Tax=Smittium megazygosporum TaxID=133381 RepID=A0A2T9ZDS5_9FUNG|nr:hypothetical protein BB560_002779 [Smittium megazygosporum]